MLSTDDQELAELADLVLNVARLIRARTAPGTTTVPLTETERQVMRLVDLHPGCTPSAIADRGRMQRTNVSTALRGLAAKGMITRTSNGDRTVAVAPTPLAADNLAGLKATWARELATALGEDRGSVRPCTALLARLEIRLTEPPD